MGRKNSLGRHTFSSWSPDSGFRLLHETQPPLDPRPAVAGVRWAPELSGLRAHGFVHLPQREESEVSGLGEGTQVRRPGWQ